MRLSVFLLLVCLVPFSFAAVSDDILIYYNFEEFPIMYDPVFPDGYALNHDDAHLQHATSYTLVLEDSNQQTTYSRVGDWALLTLNNPFWFAYPKFFLIYQSNTSRRGDINFWFYISAQDDTTIPLLGAYTTGSLGSGLVIDRHGYLIALNAGNSFWYVRYNETINTGEWYNLHLRLTHSGAGSRRYDPYLNGVKMVVNDSFGTYDNYRVDIGSSTGYFYFGSIGTDTWREDKPVDDVNLSRDHLVIFDNIIFYGGNVGRNESDIELLYNSGFGMDPYSDSAPEQLASVLPVNIGFSETETRTLTDYFSGATYFNLNFSYNSASYSVSSNSNANTGHFAVNMPSSSTIKFYSYNTNVAQQGLTLYGCNVNGCSETTIYFSVGDSEEVIVPPSEDDPEVISSILFWEVDKTKSFSAGDYFLNIPGGSSLALVFQNRSSTQWVIVEEGSPVNYECFNASVTGLVYTITPKGVACQTPAYLQLTHVDGVLYSNVFTIYTYADSSLLPGGGGGLLDMWSGIDFFPDASDIPNRTKIFIVLAVVFVSFLALLFSPGNPLLVMAVAVLVLLEVVFFTVIGYIPAWLIILILIAALGVGMFWVRNTFYGGSEGGV